MARMSLVYPIAHLVPSTGGPRRPVARLLIRDWSTTMPKGAAPAGKEVGEAGRLVRLDPLTAKLLTSPAAVSTIHGVRFTGGETGVRDADTHGFDTVRGDRV